ncbi:centromere protein O [Genypterus blacodes]|uniref:centromere protein O n=1 Tax=Genypterus blacodes TaxID=154954 RepID=UPI003F762F80
MDGASARGILSHLSLLEVQARSRKDEPQQQQEEEDEDEEQSRLAELKAKVQELTAQRDQLKAEIDTYQTLAKLRSSTDKNCPEEEEAMDEDSEHSQILRLMARHIQLKELLNVHFLLGGYHVSKSRHGKSMCVSLATAYEGVYLDTYNVEVDPKPPLRILRHDIPPFIPLNRLVEQSDMKTDIKVFLDALSELLNAYVGRKQQLKLVKEQHDSVQVMESNMLCSLLVLMFTVPREQTAVLCKLSYNDYTRTLPTQVTIECHDEELSDSPQWKKHCSLLQDAPVHTALATMRRMKDIV